MTVNELAHILRERYDTAGYGQKQLQVVLFGIEFSQQLENCSVAEVVKLSGIGTWGPMVSLGVRISERVALKK